MSIVLKSKIKTPIVFPVPKKQKEAMRALFSLSLQVIQNKTNTTTDWYNVGFRTKHCYELALSDYIKETACEIKIVLDMIVSKHNNLKTNVNWFLFSDDEYETILSVHEAMCVMEDETTRRAQLEAIYKAKNYMSKFVIL